MPDENIETLVLYLVNVFQPVSTARLKEESDRYISSPKKRSPIAKPDIEIVLDRLIMRKLVINTKGKYSVTLRGLDSVSVLGLGGLRDKNRLFNLKKAL
jgi:hypothetical protein